MFQQIIFLALVSLLGSSRFVSAEYFGKEIGQFTSYAHELSGTAYAVDSKRIRIRNFIYDGTAPAAYFWMGLKGKHSSKVDDTGIAIADENGRLLVLSKYDKADITLTLPENIMVENLAWLSVWCQQFKIDFGHVIIPGNFEAPRPTVIGQFKSGDHEIRSDNVTVLNDKTILINKFYYDGKGKDVYFVVGDKEASPNDRDLFIIVSRLDGGLKELPKFDGSDVTLTLPGSYTIFNFRFLGVYSKSENKNYGQVNIPNDLNIPPFINGSIVHIKPK